MSNEKLMDIEEAIEILLGYTRHKDNLEVTMTIKDILKIAKIIELLQHGEKLKKEIKKQIKDWRKIAKSEETPKLSGENFEKGWRLAINRVCNSIEGMIK